MISAAAPVSQAGTASKSTIEESLLTPRFYTTDFEKAANLDFSGQEDELNVEHPEFFQRLDRCAQRNLTLKKITQGSSSKIWQWIRKAPLIAGTIHDLLRLYLLQPIEAEALRGQVR